MSFFFSATLFLLCWQQKVKLILYFDKTNKNNKWATIFVQPIGLRFFFFLSATHFPIVLTAKRKTNLILDKMDKINSLQ